MEGFQNILFGGGLIIIFLKLFKIKFNILNYNYSLNNYIIILWALLYSSYHLINYTLKNPNNTHTEHHINYNTNYGPDFMDILLGTKYDTNHIDNNNDGAINLIIITIFLLLLQYFYYY